MIFGQIGQFSLEWIADMSMKGVPAIAHVLSCCLCPKKHEASLRDSMSLELGRVSRLGHDISGMGIANSGRYILSRGVPR